MNRLKFIYSISFLAIAGSAAFAQNAKVPPPSNLSEPTLSTITEKGLVPSGLWRMGDGVYFSRRALVVDKKLKKVFVLESSQAGPKIVASFDSDVGRKNGDKAARGDFKTPEGIYFFKEMKEGPGLDPKLYGVRAFVSDYPNFWDRKHEKDGSGIWLHAIDEKVGLDRGSKGCVVVRNESILKLSAYIELQKTPIVIYDSVKWIDLDANKKSSEGVYSFLQKWKVAWESQDLEKYMAFYANNFTGNRKMSKSQWRVYKNILNQNRKDLKVTLTVPVIYEHKGDLIVRFLQDYQSSAFSDFGEKVLYLKRLSDNEFTVVGEEWQPAIQADRSILASSPLCCSVASDSQKQPN